MAATINEYDLLLEEHWSDRHCQMVEEFAKLDQNEKCQSGLKILRWTHEMCPARFGR